MGEIEDKKETMDKSCQNSRKTSDSPNEGKIYENYTRPEWKKEKYKDIMIANKIFKPLDLKNVAPRRLIQNKCAFIS